MVHLETLVKKIQQHASLMKICLLPYKNLILLITEELKINNYVRWI